MTIMEIKHNLDGREERYECELLLRTDAAALVRFVFHQNEPHEDGPFRLPTGDIVTLAAFWENRPYLIYRLLDDRRELIGHRFDVCEDVRVGEEIHWTDLLLDVWMPPGGPVYVLDEAEVAEAEQSGRMTERQAAIVWPTKQFLQRHAPDVVADLEQLTVQANVAEHAEQAERESGNGGPEG